MVILFVVSFKGNLSYAGTPTPFLLRGDLEQLRGNGSARKGHSLTLMLYYSWYPSKENGHLQEP